MDKVAITGIGMISSAGIGTEPVLGAMTSGTHFFNRQAEKKRSLHPKFPWPEASLEQPDVPWPAGAAWADIKKYANQAAHQAVAVSRMAMEVSGAAASDQAALRCGAVVASGSRTDELSPLIGKLGAMAQTDPRPLAKLLYDEVPDYSYLRGIPCQSGQFICLAAGFLGSNVAVYGEAGASGLGSLAFALRLVQSGELDRVIVTAVGIPLPPPMLVAFDRHDPLGLEARPGRGPFDVNRGGTLLGHAAVAVVIERDDIAKERGAPRLANLLACEAVNATGRNIALDMATRMVLEQSARQPDFWWAHGAGSIAMDLTECEAVHPLVKAPATSSKGTIGNTFESAGLVDLALAVEALKSKQVPPIGLLETPDPALGDVDFVMKKARQLRATSNAALITALDPRVASAGAAIIADIGE
ncbi:3-oxoacyl-[acyl-carrier-protein] synthase 2 [Dyella flagellata]|uniref:3-oxoacyl-[acyl-carrier-protein] synthase 2 n=1 Tax=Dyella flagellata TaxID=1867833 RepID=A0ABQ5X8G9_9GAMM|nr:3-oxoacyl-[acyl-carrier-protein] synthase 2 [Dyella flagellata]